MQGFYLQGGITWLSAAPSTPGFQPGHKDVCAACGPPRGGRRGAPLVGKQRLEKLIIARPPGFSTRCISANTCAPPDACSQGSTQHQAAHLITPGSFGKPGDLPDDPVHGVIQPGRPGSRHGACTAHACRPPHDHGVFYPEGLQADAKELGQTARLHHLVRPPRSMPGIHPRCSACAPCMCGRHEMSPTSAPPWAG